MASSFVETVRSDLVAKICSMLEKGVAPWCRPWALSGAMANAVTGKPYSGRNVMFLLASLWDLESGADPRWATLKQANSQGWKVKKGSHGTRIEVFKPVTRKLESPKSDDNGEDEKEVGYMMTKIYTVFNACQLEGIEPITHSTTPEQAIAKADRVMQDSGAKINHALDSKGQGAFYRPKSDRIVLPFPDTFTTPADYYGTALHELVHWTGAPSRLNRKQGTKFGSDDYAFEELVAEIGSMFVSAEVGVPMPEELLQNHAAYLDNWLKALRSSSGSKIFFDAVAQAQKAADFLLQHERKRETSVPAA